MKLYHFTAEHLMESIKKEGLTKGAVPLINNNQLVGLLQPIIWLTVNPDFNQEWQKTQVLLGYKRNDYRIQISIPKSHADKLFKWDEVSQRVPYLHQTAKELGRFGDPEHWYIYKGTIKNSWFRGWKLNPALAKKREREKQEQTEEHNEEVTD